MDLPPRPADTAIDRRVDPCRHARCGAGRDPLGADRSARPADRGRPPEARRQEHALGLAPDVPAAGDTDRGARRRHGDLRLATAGAGARLAGHALAGGHRRTGQRAGAAADPPR